MKHLSYYLERRRRKSRKSRQPTTFTCFFTGMTIYKKVDPFGGYTIEHLIPKLLLKTVDQNLARITGLGKMNRVPAISIINHLVGHAPLAVKFGLRDYLRSVEVNRHMSVDDQIEVYARATRQYLDQFKVTIGEHRVNHMPWYYACMAEQEYRDKLFTAYYDLLTPEERVLLEMRYTR